MESEQGRETLDRCRALVDPDIGRVLKARDLTALHEMIRYHLGFTGVAEGDPPRLGGKRIRPALCLLACEAGGGKAEMAVPAAAAIELLHSFTLVHDDIADQDEVRRGRETVWRRWSVGDAILVGDALFALANVAVTRLQSVGVPAAAVSDVTRELNQAAVLVCEGQQRDLSYEGRAEVGVPDYVAMIERKTAALFAASTAIGARIAGAPAAMLEGMRSFGRHVGLAYQIRDDLLGIWGDPEELGKPVGSDLRRNKRSLPIVHALGAAAEAGRPELADRLARGISSDEEATALAAQMETLGSRAFCEQMAHERLERALDALVGLQLCDGPAEDLRTLASYFIERTQ